MPEVLTTICNSVRKQISDVVLSVAHTSWGKHFVEKPFDTLYPKVSINISPETSTKKAALTVS